MPESLVPDESALGEPPLAGVELAASLSLVLTTASRHAALTTLELRVTGSPALSTLVCRPTGAPGGELVVWPTSVPPDSMHDGFWLVASAAAADPGRRQAVCDTAALIERLLVADRRCAEAELLAARATAMAELDPLTQVGNRWAWRRALKQESLRAARYSVPATVLVVDLDGLKLINDTLGHAEGDAHLLRAGAALQEASRKVDTVCRLGGDEFGVLAPQTGIQGARELTDRLRESLERAGVAASVGAVAVDGGDLEAAWRDADAEMYRQKRHRPGRERAPEPPRPTCPGQTEPGLHE